uniref:hypothetical protein n=1 Tax=Salmonella sp. s60131 TaxID=3159722 RepID=UPI0039801E0A
MHEFFPFYQSINDISPDKFLGEMTVKKEFTERFLHDTNLFPHQKFIARFISPYTLYDSLILFHEMGSGKTQSAIEVAETLDD